jgi:hypothetical protein
MYKATVKLMSKRVEDFRLCEGIGQEENALSQNQQHGGDQVVASKWYPCQEASTLMRDGPLIQ